eukprot:194855_1
MTTNNSNTDQVFKVEQHSSQANMCIDINGQSGKTHPFDSEWTIYRLFQYVTNFWFCPIVKFGYKHDIQSNDCHDVPFRDSAEQKRELWIQHANARDKQNKPFSTASIVWQIEKRNIIERFIMATIAKLSGLCIPFLISALTVFFKDDTIPFKTGVYYSIGLCLVGLSYTIIFNYAFVSGGRAISSVRSYIILMIYDKSLKMSVIDDTKASQRVAQATTGQRITMVAADSQSIAFFIGWVPIMFGNLVLAIAVVIVLYYEVGPAAFAGWLFMVVVGGPCQYIVGGKIARATRKYLGASDKRVKFISELIQGIRVTKMYSWEHPLMDQVGTYRDEEAKRLMIRVKYMALMTMMNIATPQFMALILFAVYIAMGNELTLTKTFTVIALIQQLRISIKIIPFAVMLAIGAYVGCKRLDGLFMSTEKTQLQIKNGEESVHDDNVIISMQDAVFKWNHSTPAADMEESKQDDNSKHELSTSELRLVMNPEASSDFTLGDISFQVHKGDLIAVVGSVASGKSSLIAAILGEIRLISGSYYNKNGSDAIGYVSQQAFIINGTVRSNILFGLPYKEAYYEKVIEASALSHDLSILPNEDFTEIGERGINLSGGQKQRISFARALYRSLLEDIELFLCDDPLSAVDVDVGSVMFHEGICNVLNHKTRLIVMNSHLDQLKFCDKILIMDKGKIVCYESYDNVIGNHEYAHLLPKKTLDAMSPSAVKRRELKRNELDISKSVSIKHNCSYAPSKFKATMDKENAKKGALIVAENQSKGSVPWSVYGEYFSNAAQNFDYRAEKNHKSRIGFGLFTVILEVFLLILTQTFDTTSDIWLSFWSEENDKQRFPDKDNDFWLRVWCVFVICLGITAFCSSALFGYLSIKSALNLHAKTLWSVLRAPMLYFDSTPTGRILNRFSKDMNETDDRLQTNFNNFAQQGLQIIGYMVLIVYAVPYILVLFLVLVPIFYMLQKYFRQTARSLKRLEQITFSPVLNQFSESLLGLSTIRSYKLSSHFFNKFKDKINTNHQSFLTEQIAMFWFGWNTNMMVSVLMFCVSLSACWLSKYGDPDTFDNSLLSLALVYSFSLTTIIQWTMNSFVEVEKNFTAVQRLLYYQRNIDAEYDTINPEYRPPTHEWPSHGKLEIKTLSMKYRKDLDLVLKNISITVNPGQKIGICGRTGSGKSSLLLSLFRLVEPEKPSSSILIDNVDCLKLGLKDLRSNLAIIPQDPVLLSGTLKFNLDPFDEYTDDEIWDVLKKIKLYNFINEKSDKLQFIVTENGNNFSCGQKQLICIGRALLKKTKILLLDEATSSIDKHTDQLIQNLIRKEFTDRTVLCIAHRLQTIIDYDKILVLANGSIIQFDAPKQLLKDKNGAFAKMVLDKMDVNESDDGNHNDIVEESAA